MMSVPEKVRSRNEFKTIRYDVLKKEQCFQLNTMTHEVKGKFQWDLHCVC